MKNILTTFKIARLCNVDITTAINWVDSGKLNAYKTPGGHRRIKTEDLIKFLKIYGLPVPHRIESIGISILVADNESERRREICELLSKNNPEIKIWEAENSFMVGKMLVEKRPSLLLLFEQLAGDDCLIICSAIKNDRRMKDIKILLSGKKNNSKLQISVLKSVSDKYLATAKSCQKVIQVCKKMILLC